MEGSVTLVDVWRGLRDCEKSFRYMSDVVFAAGQELERRQRMGPSIPVEGDVASSIAPEEDVIIVKPPRPCPPYCEVNASKILEQLEQLRQITEASLKLSSRLMKIVKGLGSDRFPAYISEPPPPALGRDKPSH